MRWEKTFECYDYDRDHIYHVIHFRTKIKKFHQEERRKSSNHLQGMIARL